MSDSINIPVEELRQLKALLDEEIITEEEFSDKKRQLLNLKNTNDNNSYSEDSLKYTKNNEATAASPGVVSAEKMSDEYMWSFRYEED